MPFETFATEPEYYPLYNREYNMIIFFLTGFCRVVVVMYVYIYFLWASHGRELEREDKGESLGCKETCASSFVLSAMTLWSVTGPTSLTQGGSHANLRFGELEIRGQVHEKRCRPRVNLQLIMLTLFPIILHRSVDSFAMQCWRKNQTKFGTIIGFSAKVFPYLRHMWHSLDLPEKGKDAFQLYAVTAFIFFLNYSSLNLDNEVPQI